MDYERIFRRAANIVWNYKFLILLGILASLGSGGTGGFSNSGYQFSGGDGNRPPGEFNFQLPDFPADAGPIFGIAGVALLALICVGIFVGIIFLVLAAVAKGGMIAGVDQIEETGKSSLGTAWSSAWKRARTLVAIALLPAVPIVLLGLIGAVAGLSFYGAEQIVGRSLAFGSGVGILFGALACLLVPIALVLGLLQAFANRAAVLEGLGALDSYRRGWNVLTANLGSAIILFLLQLLTGFLLLVFLFVPGLLIALCCLLWPLIFIFQGAVSAFFSTVWTLAWREWTGADVDKLKPEVAM